MGKNRTPNTGRQKKECKYFLFSQNSFGFVLIILMKQEKNVKKNPKSKILLVTKYGKSGIFSLILAKLSPNYNFLLNCVL